MKQRNVILISILASVVSLVVAVAIGMFFTGGSQSAELEVETYLIEAQPSLLFSGTVVATETEEHFQDETLGELSNIEVTDGATVKKGQVLLTYKPEETDLTSLTFAVQNAQNDLNNASAEVSDTVTQLNQLTNHYNILTDEAEKAAIQEQRNSLEQTLGQQHRAVATAQLALSQAQTELSQGQAKANEIVTVTSGQDGTVIVNPNAQQGKPLVTVVSNTKTIKGLISEFDYGKLKPGDPLELTTANRKQKLKGKVASISALPVESDGKSGVNYEFIVTPDDPSVLQYGFSVEIALPDLTVFVPESAVKDNQVQLKKDGAFISQPVKSEETGTGMLKVTEGLKVGDEIKLDGNSANEE